MNKDKYEILSRLRLEIRDMKREDLDAAPYMSNYTIENIIDHTYGNVMDLIDYIIDTDRLCSMCGAVFHNGERGNNNG